MQIKITYMSGAGNIFSVIDNRQYRFSNQILTKIAPLLCNRDVNKLMPTEGMLAIDNAEKPFDFKVLFFNPDGSYSMMCGNGARCAVKFANLSGIVSDCLNQIKFIMQNSIYKAEIIGDLIKIEFPPPIEIKPQFSINTEFGDITGTYVNIESDHFAINLNEMRRFGFDSLHDIPIDLLGKSIRHNNKFPNGSNVDFLDDNNFDTIYLRTYERGVEAETGACGTGAIATALASAIENNTNFPIKIIPTSQIPVYVDIAGKLPDMLLNIYLIGPAEIIGENQVNFEIQ